ncbi:Uncharacterized protein OBRU01_23164 [Operophtera brumata]|uniref:Uncharacterized protein n=1 Tax=Operophtera brumata TaxID=104452 RepID=A0A0L7KPC2_OPEBR|nr:Uncharacterized protein OBRU01_23164 [Operophtera brumata]
MSEEHACLVRARSDSETSANLGGFGSITRTMTYTEDKLNSNMSEEHACLVRARSDSETSANLGGFGSITRTMTYTEDKLNSKSIFRRA